jgi:hypothetical protein
MTDKDHGKPVKDSLYIPDTVYPAYGSALKVLDKTLSENIFDCVSEAINNLTLIMQETEPDLMLSMVGPEFKYEDGWGGCLYKDESLTEFLLDWATDESDDELKYRLSVWKKLRNQIDSAFKEKMNE